MRVPVVPIYISGTFEVLPRNRYLPKLRPVHVSMGRAMPADLFPHAVPDEADDQRIADQLHEAVATLATRSGGRPWG
jgi:1-acyl-sn-glycerol-3-phosphate acyltransferase